MAAGGIQAFAFVDIHGFTALTEAHGDVDAAELAHSFAAAARRRAGERGGEVVKELGDGVMLRAPDAVGALETCLELTRELMGGHGMPSARAGVHLGEAVRIADDWFGRAVNLTARIAGMAAPGEVVASEAARAQAAGREGLRFESRGRHELRGIRDPVELWTVGPADPGTVRSLALDPVCHMAVAPELAEARRTWRGSEMFLCSPECLEAFDADPARYAG